MKRIHRRLRVWIFAVLAPGLAVVVLGCNAGQGQAQSESGAEAGRSGTAAEVDAPEFEPIFNGTDLSGWDGDARFWRAEDGAIVGRTTEEAPTEANTFIVWEDGEPGDFELRFRIRFVSEEGNSGVQIRSERFTDEEHPDLEHRVRGAQIDFAISDWIPGIVYDEGGRGILARRGQRVTIDGAGERQEERFAEEEALAEHIHLDDWNQYHVVALGDTIRTQINGQLMHEVIDQSPDAEYEGIIAIQLHTGPPMILNVSDIELAELEPGAVPSF